MILKFKTFEQKKDIVYRLGKESDLKDIKENKHEDIDPYGEEEWGDENFLPNCTKVKILPKLNYYIDNFGWNSNFKKFINRNTTIEKLCKYKNFNCYFIPAFPDSNCYGHYIPTDCVEEIK